MAVSILLEILWLLVRVVLIIGIIWLLIPYAFRWGASKAFDGSYNPGKDKLIVPESLPAQIDVPELVINNKNREYSVKFGEGREFCAGNVRICYQNNWYAAHPKDGENALEFIEEISAPFEGPLGKSTNLAWVWQIPGTDKRFQTVFHRFSTNPYIIFEVTAMAGLPDLQINSTKPGPGTLANVCFPVFENASYNKRIFTYRNGIFCPPQRDFVYTNGPVVLFDDARNCVMLSALNHFMTNGIQKQGEIASNYTIACGPSGEVKGLPANYSGLYIMLFGNGINKTFQNWGALMHKYYGRAKKDRYSDVMTSYLGYFTDNGAFYYYNPIKGMKYDRTLIAVKQHADEMQIPFRYYHLDSWWYRKSVSQIKRKLLGGIGRILGGGLYGGTILWEPDPEALDMTLPELQQALGAPFTAHNRWYGLETPYVDRFKFIKEGARSMPDDPAFWQHIMKYCNENNIEVYEQDWMRNQMDAFTHLRAEFGAAERWLTQMATAASENGVTIQYCMATPPMWMTSIQFPAVSNVRGCGDYGPRWPHNYDVPYFTQTGLLAGAMGLSHFKDTFESSKRGPINGERCPELMGLISSLSAGPVAPGDEIGFINPDICKAIARKDGLLYKPDRPLTPTDLTFVKNRHYYVCSTESTHLGNTWIYTLTLNLWPSRVKNREYSLIDLGYTMEQQYLEYDWFTGESRIITQNTGIAQRLKFEQYKYRIYAPVLKNGMAILGDPSKYIMMSDKEFPALKHNENSLTLTVSNIAGEWTEIMIYCSEKPASIKINANPCSQFEIEHLQNKIRKEPIGFVYNSTDHLLHIWMKFEKDGEQILEIQR
jgi:hypothetical protein